MHIFYICFVASLDSTAQTGTINVGDWQEEVYQKVICSFFAHLIAPTSGGLKGGKLKGVVHGLLLLLLLLLFLIKIVLGWEPTRIYYNQF